MKTEIQQTIAQYRQRRNALDLFDVNCWTGAPLEPTFTRVEGIGTLKQTLLRYGIRRAIVSHTMSVRYGASEGNRELLDAIRDEDALFAAATLVPEMADEEPWEALLPSLVASRVRLVRLFPASHNFLLTDKHLRGLFEWLQQLRLPLLLWHTQTTWREIAAICKDFPDLSVVVEGTGRKLFYDNRTYYPLLERLPNLFLETHNLTNYLGLDDLVRRFGSRRFLYGSYFPYQDPNAAAMLISDGIFPGRQHRQPTTSGCSDSKAGSLGSAHEDKVATEGDSETDRRNIACGNLERLVAEVRQS